jgi:hypothetical protein
MIEELTVYSSTICSVHSICCMEWSPVLNRLVENNRMSVDFFYIKNGSSYALH